MSSSIAMQTFQGKKSIMSFHIEFFFNSLEQPASLNTWCQPPIESCTTWMRDEFPHKIHIIPEGKITLQRCKDVSGTFSI